MKKQENEQVIVLLSGGLDSTTILGLVREDYEAENVIAVNMHYGQHNTLEICSARAVATYYDVELLEIDLTPVFENMKSAMLSLMPYEDDDFYVPNRNATFLSIAGSLADSLGASKIYFGAHKDDAGGYPDTTREFFESMSHTLRSGTRNNVVLAAPFIDDTKDEIVKAGAEIQVPWHLTHSCYMNKKPACGKCDTCKLRAEAFKNAGYEDPLVKELDTKLVVYTHPYCVYSGELKRWLKNLDVPFIEKDTSKETVYDEHIEEGYLGTPVIINAVGKVCQGFNEKLIIKEML